MGCEVTDAWGCGQRRRLCTCVVKSMMAERLNSRTCFCSRFERSIALDWHGTPPAAAPGERKLTSFISTRVHLCGKWLDSR
eukprot:scaffold133306_cov98-Phaeocystis_antarctica.AAC.5